MLTRFFLLSSCYTHYTLYLFQVSLLGISSFICSYFYIFSSLLMQKKPSQLSRFQTKQRRRREGKTNYTKRHKLLRQDCSLYGQPKNRLIVRITNTKCIITVTKSYIGGDVILCRADSTELRRFGLNFGLKNYTACYLTGLLIGKKMEHKYNATFNCILDIGLRHKTLGGRVFGAMKGAVDGGIMIPHDEKILENHESRLFNQSLVNINKKEMFTKMKEMVDMSNIKAAYEEVIKRIQSETGDYMKECENKDNKKGIYKEMGKKYVKGKMTREEKREKVEAKLKAI